MFRELGARLGEPIGNVEAGAMRRIALAVAMLTAAPAAAQEITAEQAIANFRTSVETPVRRCPEPEEGEEIVVCGDRPEESRYRVPLYVAPDDSPAARAGGEQRAAMALNDQRCTPVGRAQQCGGGLPVIEIAIFLVRTAIAAIQGDD
jgi:hypothetical protein